MNNGRFVTVVTNNEGGAPAEIHDSLDAAKAWVIAYLKSCSDQPTAEERARILRDLAAIAGGFPETIWTNDAWKETIIIAPIADLQLRWPLPKQGAR